MMKDVNGKFINKEAELRIMELLMKPFADRDKTPVNAYTTEQWYVGYTPLGDNIEWNGVRYIKPDNSLPAFVQTKIDFDNA